MWLRILNVVMVTIFVNYINLTLKKHKIFRLDGNYMRYDDGTVGLISCIAQE